MGGSRRIIRSRGAERIERHGDRRRQICILHETPVSARLDGGDRIGYVVAYRATTVAIEKAEDAGIAVGDSSHVQDLHGGRQALRVRGVRAPVRGVRGHTDRAVITSAHILGGRRRAGVSQTNDRRD
jgi:hypothetical protein